MSTARCMLGENFLSRFHAKNIDELFKHENLFFRSVAGKIQRLQTVFEKISARISLIQTETEALFYF